MGALRWLYLCLLLLPLLGTARPAASAPSGFEAPALSSGTLPLHGVVHDSRVPGQDVLLVRSKSSSRDRGLAEDPSGCGHLAPPAPRLRLRLPGARCESLPPFERLGLGASDLPPPALAS